MGDPDVAVSWTVSAHVVPVGSTTGAAPAPSSSALIADLDGKHLGLG